MPVTRRPRQRSASTRLRRSRAASADDSCASCSPGPNCTRTSSSWSAGRTTPPAEPTSRLARRVARELKAAGWRLERVLSDNGNEFRGHAFHDILKRLGARHSRIHAGRPQTNGHVEALHKTVLDELAAGVRALPLPTLHRPAPRARRLPRLLQPRPRPPRPPHRRPDPRRPRLRCPQNGAAMSRTCRHISESAQPKPPTSAPQICQRRERTATNTHHVPDA
jgi:hypothetical protein